MFKEKMAAEDVDGATGTNETGEPTRDIDAIRAQLHAQLQEAKAEKVPNLALVDVIKNIEHILNELDEYEKEVNPDDQKKIIARVDDEMEKIRHLVDLSNRLQNDKYARNAHGVNTPTEPEKVTVIVPPDWENRPQ